MTNNELFRHETIRHLDSVLKSVFVRGKNRDYLTALRMYIPTMPDSELDKFQALMPRQEKKESCDCPQEVKDAATAALVGSVDSLVKTFALCDLIGVEIPDTKVE